MKTINLKDSSNRLSRNEMKTIQGGLNFLSKDLSFGGGTGCSGSCNVTLDGVKKSGTCTKSGELCYCSSGLGSC